MPERGGDAEHRRANLPSWNAAVRLQARTVKEAGVLEIVWRNPQPPAHRTLQIEEVFADESTVAPMWVIFYHTLVESGWAENEYRLLVNRNFGRTVAVPALEGCK